MVDFGPLTPEIIRLMFSYLKSHAALSTILMAGRQLSPLRLPLGRGGVQGVDART